MFEVVSTVVSTCCPAGPQSLSLGLTDDDFRVVEEPTHTLTHSLTHSPEVVGSWFEVETAGNCGATSFPEQELRLQ